MYVMRVAMCTTPQSVILTTASVQEQLSKTCPTTGRVLCVEYRKTISV